MNRKIATDALTAIGIVVACAAVLAAVTAIGAIPSLLLSPSPPSPAPNGQTATVEMRVRAMPDDASGYISNQSSEQWFYGLLNALSDPRTIRYSVAGATSFEKSWVARERVYLKDFDDLNIEDRDHEYITGGLVFGHIMALPPGTYYHYKNSGLMYATASSVEEQLRRSRDAREQYYRRVRYVLETSPDQEIHFASDTGRQATTEDIDVGARGAVLSFAASGGAFVVANVYLDEGNGNRTVNGMGLGTYNPTLDKFSYTGNLHTTPLNMVPLPSRDGLRVRLHIFHNGLGHSYVKIHHVPEWW